MNQNPYIVELNHYSEGIVYAKQIVRGDIAANKYLVKICQRFLDYYERTDWRWVFSGNHAQHVITFINQLKLSKGVLAGQPFKLQPFQVLLICGVFGFVDKENPKLCMVRVAAFYAPRKTGKSEFAAALALYFLACREAGSQVFSIAVDRNQANLIFNTAKTFIRTAPVWISEQFKVNLFEVKCKLRDSTYKALSRDARKSGDGLNPELVLADESAQLDREVIEVLESGMVARQSPLIFHTTTASFRKDTKFYENLTYMRNILNGIIEDNERFFFLIYELDDDMDWRDPQIWRTCNPMHGITVFEDAIEARVKEANAKPAMIPELLTKTFNIYTSSDANWLDTRAWENCPSAPPPEPAEQTFITFDLAMTRDLCCVCTLQRWSMERYHINFQFFLPEQAFQEMRIHEAGILREAVARGIVKLTPGKTADYFEVEDYIINEWNRTNAKVVGYDSWNASGLVSNLQAKGVPLEQVKQTAEHLSSSTKATEKLIYDGGISHNHDPIMLWQLQNVVVYTDVNLNVKLKRPEWNMEAKIDGVISMIMAMNLSLKHPVFSLPKFGLV